MKFLLHRLSLCFLFTSSSIAAEKVQRVIGKNGLKFYHLEYTLTPENSQPPFGKSKWGSREFSLREDDLFEIFVKNDAFPIKSKAKEFLILRMPSSRNGRSPLKAEVFNAIKKMFETKKGSVRVVIELEDGYYDEKTATLDGVNIFFRHSHGNYIDYTGPIKATTTTTKQVIPNSNEARPK